MDPNSPQPALDSSQNPSAPTHPPEHPFIDGSIENVQASTMGYLKRHLPWTIAILAITIALLALLIFTRIPFIPLYIIVLFIPICGYSWVSNQVQHEFMQQFAAACGYTYAAQGDLTGLDGTIFQIGDNRTVTDVVSGQYQNRPISLFAYTYVVRRGRSSQTYHKTVFSLKFDAAMPNILLQNGPEIVGNIMSANMSGMTVVKLEGNFNKYFSLVVPKGFEIEALEIFTPEVMQELIEKAKDLSIEIIHDHCFVYKNGIVSTKQDLYALYGLAEYFDQKLGPLLSQMKGSVAAMEEEVAKYKNA